MLITSTVEQVHFNTNLVAANHMDINAIYVC